MLFYTVTQESYDELLSKYEKCKESCSFFNFPNANENNCKNIKNDYCLFDHIKKISILVSEHFNLIDTIFEYNPKFYIFISNTYFENIKLLKECIEITNELIYIFNIVAIYDFIIEYNIFKIKTFDFDKLEENIKKRFNIPKHLMLTYEDIIESVNQEYYNLPPSYQIIRS